MIENPYLFAFLASNLASLLLVLTQRWHGRLSMDSTQGVQKMHSRPTPRIGGIAVALGLLASYAVSTAEAKHILGYILLAGIPAFLSGLLEDLTKKISVQFRLLATMASGLMACYLFNIAMQNTGLPPLDWLLGFMPLAVMFTAFAVSGVANAINIIDGFNGLAAGTVAIISGSLGVMALSLNDQALALVCFSLAAVALGFGLINWPSGRLFLGDGGAYLLGFVLAWVAVFLPMRHPEINAWATLLACAYPVLEVLFSVLRRRKREGHHPGQPDKAHLHHFIHRRFVPRFAPTLGVTWRNSVTSLFCWVCALVPAAWAVLFMQDERMLCLGLGFSALAYMALYARLTQFAWCFSAITLRRPTRFTT